MGYFVYIHTNKVDGKRYVGLTTQNPKRRWSGGYGYKGCTHFYAAIQAYGWDAFDHWYIEVDNQEQMEDLEMLLIDYFDTTNPKNGYNLTSGGEHPIHSDETKQKMSKAQKGKYISDETKQKMSKAQKGKHHTDETKQKLSIINRGKHHTDETKQKISDAKKGKHISDYHRKRISDGTRKRVVLQYSKDGEFIKEWPSLISVEKEIGIIRQHVYLCCRGKLKSTGGFIWRYGS